MRLILLIPLLFAGCATYKIPTQSFAHPCPTVPFYDNAVNHRLYAFIPRHRSQIRIYDIGHWLTWMLAGNDDDGIFGEEPSANFKESEPPSVSKALSWILRNPLHNFTFYVIGSAHRKNSEFAILSLSPRQFRLLHYRPHATTVFPSNCSCLYLGLHGGKPFFSLRLAYTRQHRGDFYIGWRCRGNFGIKFQPLKTVH